MVLGGIRQIHATPLYSFSNEREQILAGCQVSATYNFIVRGDIKGEENNARFWHPPRGHQDVPSRK